MKNRKKMKVADFFGVEICRKNVRTRVKKTFRELLPLKSNPILATRIRLRGCLLRFCVEILFTTKNLTLEFYNSFTLFDFLPPMNWKCTLQVPAVSTLLFLLFSRRHIFPFFPPCFFR